MDIQCCICLSKNEEINIPVKINKDFVITCDCKNNIQYFNNIYCLSCIEDWLEPYNYKTNKFTKFITTGKCLFCRKFFSQNYKISDFCKIDYTFLEELDKINPSINCIRCNLLLNNRFELLKHLENDCPNKIIECQNCTSYKNLSTIKKHIRFDKKCVNIINKNCNTCKNKIPLFEFNAHIKDCPEQLIECSYCDEILKKYDIITHLCDYNKLKRKILVLKEINKNLLSFNHEKLFQFRFQCFNLKPFIKDNLLTPPTIDEVNSQINDIFTFSTTFIDLILLKDPAYLQLPKYNIYNNS
jgi:hypothetical protein